MPQIQGYGLHGESPDRMVRDLGADSFHMKLQSNTLHIAARQAAVQIPGTAGTHDEVHSPEVLKREAVVFESISIL